MNDVRTVQIQRGLPGSGKSYRAQCLIEKLNVTHTRGVICSADSFFYKQNGSYEYDVRKLSDAHNFCLKKFIDSLYQNEASMIVVDNTNIKFDEFEIYLKLAVIAGCNIIIDEKKPEDDAEVLKWFHRCVHNVPFETISRRYKQWEEIPNSWRGKVSFAHKDDDKL